MYSGLPMLLLMSSRASLNSDVLPCWFKFQLQSLIFQFLRLPLFFLSKPEETTQFTSSNTHTHTHKEKGKKKSLADFLSARVADYVKCLFMSSSGMTGSRCVFLHQYCLPLLAKVRDEMKACEEANSLKKLNIFETFPCYTAADTRVFVQNLHIQ